MGCRDAWVQLGRWIEKVVCEHLILVDLLLFKTM